MSKNFQLRMDKLLMFRNKETARTGTSSDKAGKPPKDLVKTRVLKRRRIWMLAGLRRIKYTLDTKVIQPSIMASKLIREYEVTSAKIRDLNVFEEILTDDTSKYTWADSAYRSEGSELTLNIMGYRSHVNTKGKRGKPLTEREKKANKRKLKIRARFWLNDE